MVEGIVLVADPSPCCRALFTQALAKSQIHLRVVEVSSLFGHFPPGERIALVLCADELHGGDAGQLIQKLRSNRYAGTIGVFGIMPLRERLQQFLAEQDVEVFDKRSLTAGIPELLAKTLRKEEVSQSASDVESDEEILCEFVNSSRDALDSIEPVVLGLGRTVYDDEQMSEVFRYFHSLKGTASLLGFGTATQLAHATESFLEPLRKAARPASSGHIALLCETMDMLRDFFDVVETKQSDLGLSDSTRKLSAELAAY